MRSLKAEGVSIMFVTHRLEEAMAICDRVTILRDGRLAAVRDRGALTISAIIQLMVGRAAAELYRRPAVRHQAGPVRLAVRGLCTAVGQRASLQGIDFEVRAGEIVGIAGLVGAGRTELARALFGADRFASGRIEVDGNP